MGTHELCKYPNRRQRKLAGSGRITVLALAIFGYGLAVRQHAGLALTAASQFMLESQAAALEWPAHSIDRQGTSATAAVPVGAPSMKPVTREFDYFPDHYVNQATKAEEPIATF